MTRSGRVRRTRRRQPSPVIRPFITSLQLLVLLSAILGPVNCSAQLPLRSHLQRLLLPSRNSGVGLPEVHHVTRKPARALTEGASSEGLSPPAPPEATDPGTARCRSGACLAAAVADPAIVTVVLMNDMALSAADWAAVRPLPVVLGRNLTITGPDTEWPPLLNLGFLASYVRLVPRATLTLTAVVLEDWRSGSATRVPGFDIIAPNTATAAAATASPPPPAPAASTADATAISGGAGTAGAVVAAAVVPPAEPLLPVLVLRDCAITYRVCGPPNVGVQAATTVSRPTQLPGANRYASPAPWPPNCTNTSAAPPLQRCWPRVSLFYDFGLSAVNLDPKTNVTIVRSGYLMLLVNVHSLCHSIASAECMERYGILGCELYLLSVYGKKSPAPLAAALPLPPLPSPSSMSAEPADSIHGSAWRPTAGVWAVLAVAATSAALMAILVGTRAWLSERRLNWRAHLFPQCGHAAAWPGAARSCPVGDDGAIACGSGGGGGGGGSPSAAGSKVITRRGSEFLDSLAALESGTSGVEKTSAGGGTCTAAAAGAATSAAAAAAVVMAAAAALSSGGLPPTGSQRARGRLHHTHLPSTESLPITPQTPSRTDLVLGVRIRLGLLGLGLSGPPPATASPDMSGLESLLPGGPPHLQQRQQQQQPQQRLQEQEQLRRTKPGLSSSDVRQPPGTLHGGAVELGPAAPLEAPEQRLSGSGGGPLPPSSLRTPLMSWTPLAVAPGSNGAHSGPDGADATSAVGQEVVTLLPVLRGRGTFGSVYEGLWRGQQVAVKVLRFGEAAMTWGASGNDGKGARGASGPAPAGGSGPEPSPTGARPCGSDGGNQAGEEAAVALRVNGGTGGGGAVTEDGGGSRRWLRGMEQEVAVLGRCAHPNVVRLLAACLTPPRVCLVMELMETSLDRLLYGNCSGDGCTDHGTGDRCGGTEAQSALLPLDKVLLIATQIAEALEYLHPTIVHRDLKPANVLLNAPLSDCPTVKLTDFGLSRLCTDTLATLHPEAGTPAYLAPECYDLQQSTVMHQSDMYSFGVLLWTLLTRAWPWQGFSIPAVAYKVAVLGERLPLERISDRRCPPRLRRLVRQCWDADPLRRPAAAEAAKELRLMLLEHREAQAPGGAAQARGGAPSFASGSLLYTVTGTASVDAALLPSPQHGGTRPPAPPSLPPPRFGPAPGNGPGAGPGSLFSGASIAGGTFRCTAGVTDGGAGMVGNGMGAEGRLGGAASAGAVLVGGASQPTDVTNAAAYSNAGAADAPVAAAMAGCGGRACSSYSFSTASSVTLSRTTLARQLEGLQLEIDLDV